MNKQFINSALRLSLLGIAMLIMPASPAAQQTDAAQTKNRVELEALGRQLEAGDVVYIRIPFRPFTDVSDTTQSWTNHVGIVIDTSGKEPMIAESRFPLSGKTTWSRFVSRSEAGRVAVTRLGEPLDPEQRSRLLTAANARSGVLYDTGFDLHSHRQFCSRYVREVLEESVGIKIGKVENFSTLLAKNPQVDLGFWKKWYFGYIPWQRETVTPASLLLDSQMDKVFDGYARK